jgi:hypothetical protein
MEFFDLEPEERGAIYDRAEEEHGGSFFDLDPEIRASYYEFARERDW